MAISKVSKQLRSKNSKPDMDNKLHQEVAVVMANLESFKMTNNPYFVESAWACLGVLRENLEDYDY